jgi:hypothetical protein
MALAIFLYISYGPYQPHNDRGIEQSHQQSPMWVEGIHTAGCCSVPRRCRFRHCYHHLTAMQNSAWCPTPRPRWFRFLFPVLGRYHPPLGGRLCVGFVGLIKWLVMSFRSEWCRMSHIMSLTRTKILQIKTMNEPLFIDDISVLSLWVRLGNKSVILALTLIRIYNCMLYTRFRLPNMEKIHDVAQDSVTYFSRA